MENKNQPKKKLIFSSAEDKTNQRLQDKGVELKLAQSKHKKGDDLDSEILSQMVDNLEPKKQESSNTQLLKELSSYNEFDDDLSIQTKFSLKMKKRKRIYKNLFIVVLMALIFVFSYWFQNDIIDFSTSILDSDDNVSSVDLNYKSEFLFTTLLNSSVVNKQIAVLSLEYLESLKESESVFKTNSQKKSATDKAKKIKFDLTENFNKLKLNLLKSQRNNLEDKSVLIKTINSSDSLDADQKSDLVSLLKFAPILSLLSQDYANFQDDKFLKFLKSYLEVTNKMQLNNIALIQIDKFNQNKFLIDLEKTLQNADAEFELFKTSPRIELVSVQVNSSSKQGSVNLNIKLDQKEPLKDFLNIEESFLNSNNFKGDLSKTFNLESLSKEDFYNLNLKFQYI